MIRIATAQGTLVRRGFVDAVAAERIIADWDAELEVLVDLAAQAADPDLALNGLSRLSEVAPDLLGRLARTPQWARRLIMALGASASLGQHLIAHPEHVDVLNADVRRTPPERLRAELLTAVGAEQDDMPLATDLTGDGLRLAYRKALLRIAARDLTSPEPIEILDDIAGELSDLADATLGAALAIGRAKVGDDSRLCRLAVIGLGKCGAQELNYVSDVDVLFVAEPRPDENGEPLITSDRAITVATRMAAEMTRICSAHTAAGTIWEVDAALRPEGRAGQLVRTLASHRIYYEKWAKTWEFQAMLKARPSAGDLELGQDFVEMISPMVWRAAERENFVSDAQAMRKRVVAHIPGPERRTATQARRGRASRRRVLRPAVATGPWSGRRAARARATAPRTQVLDRQRLRGREDGKGFALAYRFLRTLEHRIQLFNLRRTHVLPDNEMIFDGSAVPSATPIRSNDLLSLLAHSRQRVRRLHERLFYSPCWTRWPGFPERRTATHHRRRGAIG